MQHIWHLLSARRSRFIIWCKGECDYGWKVNTYLRSMWQNGNYDTGGTDFHQQWNCNEIYTGPLFIAKKILLSHEPAYGLPWCLNIHGHDYNHVELYKEGCKHINLAANVCVYTPINLGKIIKEGVLADVPSIHRMTIDRASEPLLRTSI